jgi:transcriptional regulator with XRE-family HTH domain
MPMAKNWAGVAGAINARMDELKLTQQEVASRAGVAIQTVRELQHNLVERKRTSRTLEVVSEALELPRGYLGEVLNGRSPESARASGDEVIADLYARIADVTERLEALEGRMQRQ